MAELLSLLGLSGDKNPATIWDDPWFLIGDIANKVN